MKEVKQNRLKEEKILVFLNKINNLTADLNIFDETESTNDFLIKNYKTNTIGICLAESQTKGRGRNNKAWQSPKFQNIYMSLGFATKNDIKDLSSFSLVSAICIQRALKKQDVQTEIKWPNDIYLNSKKVGGILIETVRKKNKNIIIIGIGLNVFMSQNSKIDREWTSLGIEKKEKFFDRNEIICNVIEEILRNKELFEKYGFGFFEKEFNSLNFLKNKNISVTNSIYRNCKALDINADGSLNIKVNKKIEKIFSGEVSIKIN